MRKLAVLHARISLNPVYATLFVLTSLTLALTGLGRFGTESLIQNTPIVGWVASQAATYLGFVFDYIDPIWYLNNMVPIFWAGTAFAALNILVVFSAPYLLRGEKQLKLKSHFDFKHVIRTLFPTVVFVTYPMLLAQGLANSGVEGAAAFADQAYAMSFFADNVLIYGFIASGIQIVHGSAYAFLKGKYNRHIAYSKVESIEADLRAVGIEDENLAAKLQGMNAKKIGSLAMAAQKAVHDRKAAEEFAAEQDARMRQLGEEDIANQNLLRKLLSEASATPKAPTAEQPADAPKGPVLIELDDEPEASHGEAQKV
ncbi:MAG: hypothetical protein VX730_07390 [Pseudomonadota bacterium]|nr:hypothetical protein [Pseudomonadota bacterium]